MRKGGSAGPTAGARGIVREGTALGSDSLELEYLYTDGSGTRMVRGRPIAEDDDSITIERRDGVIRLFKRFVIKAERPRGAGP